MKINKEIPQDMLEIGDKIRQLPGLIEKHMGQFPQSFPGGYDPCRAVKDWSVDMELNWKRWIFNYLIVNTTLSEIFDEDDLPLKDDLGYGY